MVCSKRLASVMGPALIALAITEPLNWAIFEQQSAPVVYLNGSVLFVTGLALVQAHNRWAWGWPLLVTLTSWVLLFGGLFRMIAPSLHQLQAGIASAVVFGVVGTVGLALTYQGYRRAPSQKT